MDEGEYDVCSYCNKSVFPGVARCPYCGHYTDEEGPHGVGGPRRIPRIFVVAGILVAVAFILPVLVALWRWATR